LQNQAHSRCPTFPFRSHRRPVYPTPPRRFAGYGVTASFARVATLVPPPAWVASSMRSLSCGEIPRFWSRLTADAIRASAISRRDQADCHCPGGRFLALSLTVVSVAERNPREISPLPRFPLIMDDAFDNFWGWVKNNLSFGTTRNTDRNAALQSVADRFDRRGTGYARPQLRHAVLRNELRSECLKLAIGNGHRPHPQ